MEYKKDDIVICVTGMGKGTIAKIVDRYNGARSFILPSEYRVIIVQPGKHSRTKPRQVYHWTVTKFRLATKLEKYLYEIQEG
jgi:hypothetical protein